MSTTKSEYMVVGEDVKQSLLLIGFVRELCVEQGGVRLHFDSQGAIYFVNN